MSSKENFRELSIAEQKAVNGGFNIPSVLGGIALAWNIGYGTGQAINRYNSSRGRSLGGSIYRFSNK